MRGFIVITSVQLPTAAVERLARLKDWTVVMVGDSKTPSDWACDGVVFLDVERQADLGFNITAALPFGHYARKNIGYLYAMREGADVIFETDDDNVLLADEIPVAPARQRVPVISSADGFVNVYRLYTDRRVWPRGFPLDLIRSEATIEQQVEERSVPVHQGLANEDPDVDAIYRLVDGSLFDFERGGRYALAHRNFCPFNSQATLWYPTAYWAMLLPGTVAMRVTDIWRGYIAQALLGTLGHTVLFTEPIMRQHRNVHDLLHDFVEELPFYRDVRRFVEVARAVPRSDDPLEMLMACYGALREAGMIEQGDARLAAAWCDDIRALQ
jgi:hypothetical protein